MTNTCACFLSARPVAYRFYFRVKSEGPVRKQVCEKEECYKFQTHNILSNAIRWIRL